MIRLLITPLLILHTTMMIACSATQHASDVRHAQDGDRVTVGTVQREIDIGMAAATVAAVLGSPNIVTTDDERQETWIYDKIATDITYARSNGSIVGLLFGSSGAAVASGSRSSGASSTSQRTLTVIVKMDGDNRVRDFSYHTSRF